MTGAGEEIAHYQRLGVARHASAGEIRRAYRRLARQHHPDLNPRPDGAERVAALAHAYEILNDPAARARYDHTPARQAPIGPSAATRDSPRPADQPITLRGILELSPHEA